MADDNAYQSPQDFLEKMDAGDFDGRLHVELQKLSKDQLAELAQILMERDRRRT